MSSDPFDLSVADQLRKISAELDQLEQRQKEDAIEHARLLGEGSSFADGLRRRGSGAQELIPERFAAGRGVVTQHTAPAGTQGTGSEHNYAGAAPRPERLAQRGPKPPRVSHEDMAAWCHQILIEHGGGPMHVNEIRDALERDDGGRDWRVPGKGTASNVSVHLARAEDVFEPGRSKGTWQLINRGGN
jgi:hypothetical protein